MIYSNNFSRLSLNKVTLNTQILRRIIKIEEPGVKMTSLVPAVGKLLDHTFLVMQLPPLIILSCISVLTCIDLLSTAR